ncbi:hypothetical protein BDV96DRAFT_479154, partial [Lophiotrema nucula]
RRHMQIPRSLTIDPNSEDFNRVVRLEGQINTAVELLRYRLRYTQSQDAPPGLYAAVEAYFSTIDQLQSNFLSIGLDLAGARNHDDFVRLVNQGFFGPMRPDLRASPHWWPMLLWTGKFQKILENEGLSIQDALIEGWRYFMTPGDHPWWGNEIVQYRSLWHSLSTSDQTRFLEHLRVGREVVEGGEGEIQTFNLQHPRITEIEAIGCRREFASLRGLNSLIEQEARLDSNHPQMDKPTEDEVSTCPICLEDLKKEEIDTAAEHRPVKTTCGHVFGYSCIREWFGQQPGSGCPNCRRSFSFSSRHRFSPEEVLAAYDQRMRWWPPPPNIQFPPEPYTHLAKLIIIFEPADVIRCQLLRYRFQMSRIAEENADLILRLRYIARDRLAAALSGDVERYRSVIREQVHLRARQFMFIFLNYWHPD